MQNQLYQEVKDGVGTKCIEVPINKNLITLIGIELSKDLQRKSDEVTPTPF